jgi:transposase-like protein
VIKNELAEGSRIPAETHGIQVNFCKNPKCPNFGVSAMLKKQSRGPRAREKERDTYTVHSRTDIKGLSVPALECNLCGEKPPIKSNLAIDEEMNRILGYLKDKPTGCPDPKCPNNLIDISAGKFYYSSFGTTKSGSQRYRCKLCKTTFSVGTPTKQQREPHKNVQVFRLLVNKMPLKRISEAADISMPSLYDKIDFIHQQCMAFAASRERQLLDGMPIKRLYLSVDRQDYLINWSDAKDKRNVILTAIGSADNTTGYVFGMHLNFDSAADRLKIEADAVESKDHEKRLPFKKYARLWLREDYADAVLHPVHHEWLDSSSLQGNIESAYQEAINRDDVEVSEVLDDTVKLPGTGMQVHSEYTQYGHFFFLKKLLSGAEKIRFYMDQESGIRAACIGAFVDEIRQSKCDAFYVRINKDLTVDERKKALAESRKKWNKLKKAYPELTDSQLKLHIIKDQMRKMRRIGKWQDKWVIHPFPDMSEPAKAVCYLTDMGQYDEDHIAWLYKKASLHGIDRFFMQARRRISLLERPISTPSAAGRRWFGYSPYNPVMVIKMLDIFRVFYNFVETGKDDQSPAMRLGLAKGHVSMEDIIYFVA